MKKWQIDELKDLSKQLYNSATHLRQVIWDDDFEHPDPLFCEECVHGDEVLTKAKAVLNTKEYDNGKC